MSLIRAALAVLITVGAATEVLAQQCQFSMTNIDFGGVNVGLPGISSTTGTFSASCTGTPNGKITICPNFGEGSGTSASGNPRYMRRRGALVPYGLYADAGGSQIWGSNFWAFPYRPPVLTMNLNAAGSGSLSRTVYAKITGTLSGAVTGNYQSRFSGANSLIDYGYAPAQSCSTASARAVRVPFTVRVQNNSSCNVATTDMNFGNQTSLTTAKTASNTISVTCTSGVQYIVGLSNGSNGGTSPTNRLMAATTNTSKISYGIFRDTALANAWGGTIGTNTVAGIGTGTTRDFSAYGRIPVQATPPVGAYSDTVVVTVTY